VSARPSLLHAIAAPISLLLSEIIDANRLFAEVHASSKPPVACSSFDAALELQLCVYLHEMNTTEQLPVQWNAVINRKGIRRLKLQPIQYYTVCAIPLWFCCLCSIVAAITATPTAL
jgi:hypothetical protein